MTEGRVGAAALGALGLALSVAGSAWAQTETAAAAQAPAVTTQSDTSEITLGGRLTLTVGVEHAADERVTFPDSVDLSPFEVLRVETADPVPRAGNRRATAARYTLTSFELGEHEVPAFDVAVVAPDGDAQVLETSPWGVVVSAVGIDESGDIRDVKAPLSIPLSALVVLGWLLLAILVVAGLYALYHRFRAQPAAEPLAMSAPLRRPYEVAYDRLRELEAARLIERGAIKEHYIEVSEIIREYVEDQFHVPALEMASFEVLDSLVRIGVDEETHREFEGFLAECDLVKFAKFRPDGGRARQIVPRARKLVDRTKVGRPAPLAGLAVAAVPAGPGAPDRAIDADDDEGEALPSPGPVGPEPPVDTEEAP